MPRSKGVWWVVSLTQAEFETMRLVVRACLEAGGDEDRLMPLMVRLQEALARHKKLKKRRKEER